MSSGSGASHSSARPVMRMGQRSRAACSAWRGNALRAAAQSGAAARGRPPPAAIYRIADNGITDVRKMYADLVGASGLELHPHQSVGAKSLDDAVVRNGRAPIASHRHTRALRAVASDGRIHRAAARHRATCRSQGRCALSRAPPARRRVASAPRACAPRRADRWCPYRGDAPAPPAAPGRASDRGPAAHSAGCGARLPAPGMHDHAGRLVDDEEGAILVDHRQRYAPPGATRSSASSRASISTCSPPSTLSLARSRRPSTWTAPASIQPCRRAREYCGSARARAWSSRRPAASSAHQGMGPELPAVRRSEGLPADSLYSRAMLSSLPRKGRLYALLLRWQVAYVHLSSRCVSLCSRSRGCAHHKHAAVEPAGALQAGQEGYGRRTTTTRAIKTYEQLTARFPFTDQAHQARLDLIYAYYRAGETDSATDAGDTFIRENPTHPRVDYA